MVIIAAKVFLFNLLCSVVPCEPNYGQPRISPGGPPARYRVRPPRQQHIHQHHLHEHHQHIIHQHPIPIPPPQLELHNYPQIMTGLQQPVMTGLPNFPNVFTKSTRMLQVENEIDTGPTPIDQNSPEPIVYTRNGGVEGYFMMIINGRVIYAFEGIPYAKPPVGNLRFRAPEPVDDWEGVRQAKNPGTICLQIHLSKLSRILGKEDCLTLNIYSPTLPVHYQNYNPKMAVLVVIHGGGFSYGAGSEYGPSYLLREDLVLVTVNYRQGILGFLSTGDYEAPGNYGLKDQALALKWIADNIVNFGGDPRRVTLIGQSSGAASVHLHMMSPLSRDLFQGAIIRSGSAFNHWAIAPYSKSSNLTTRLGTRLGCRVDMGSRILMECVRAVDPNYLIYHQQRLHDLLTFPPILFGPVVELPSPEAFLTDTPANLYARNEVAKIPLIVSETTEEADSSLIVINSLGLTQYFLRNWHQFAPHILDYNYIARNVSDITEKMRQFYMRDRDPLSATLREISNVASDRYFYVGLHKTLQVHSQIAPTYGLIFGFKSEIGFASNWGLDPTHWGVGHGEDNSYIFNSSVYFRPIEKGRPAFEGSKVLTNFITNFAQKREPYLTIDNGEIVRIWSPVKDARDIQLLKMDNDELKMVPEQRIEAIRFWESLGLADTVPYNLPPPS